MKTHLQRTLFERIQRLELDPMTAARSAADTYNESVAAVAYLATGAADQAARTWLLTDPVAAGPLQFWLEYLALGVDLDLDDIVAYVAALPPDSMAALDRWRSPEPYPESFTWDRALFLAEARRLGHWPVEPAEPDDNNERTPSASSSRGASWRADPAARAESTLDPAPGR